MLPYRKYGVEPYQVALLHGGPGAPGEMAPVALELSEYFGVIEPFQSRHTVEGQVQELKEIIEKNTQPPITLIGWSWGAWLGFIFTAKNPALVKKLILVGAGPFEQKYALKIMNTRLERLDELERSEVMSLMETLEDPNTSDKDGIFERLGELIYKADSYDPIPYKSDVLEFQYLVFHDVWTQASELRKNGQLLEYGKKIKCPVVAIHGDYDPHPYHGVKEPLEKVIKDFRFILFPRCGHQPWIEVEMKEKFFEILQNEIGK
jgi:pimeloyl-ACP methyl ester carboxylesterase